MKTIYKYELRDITYIKGHIEGTLELAYQPSSGCDVVWVLMNDECPEVEIKITAYGTGWPLSKDLDSRGYIGTTMGPSGYVWHYFGEVIEKEDISKN